MRMIAALCLVVALVSCGVDTQGDAHVFDAAEVPYGLANTAPPPTTASVGFIPYAATTPATVTYDLYFINRSDVLVAVTRQATTMLAPVDLVATLVAGPTRTEVAAGYRTALSGPDIVTDTRATATVVTVDLAKTFNDIPRSDRIFALGQITLTLTTRPGVTLVQYTIGGAAIEVPKANGVVTRDPVSRADYANLLQSRTASPSTATSTVIVPSPTTPATTL
jgi:hypothetical protein